MAAPRSAGILLYRVGSGAPEVLLVHPGGPFWRNKDAGAWMIPKGLVEPGEAALDAARREFVEELGSPAPDALEPLCTIRQKGGKWVEAFAAEGDLDADAIVSAGFRCEWPPRSGELQTFPEVDRAQWFGLDDARRMMLPSQHPILDALIERLAR